MPRPSARPRARGAHLPPGASPDIDLVQLLAPTGELADGVDPDETGAVSGSDLRALHRDLVLTRRLDVEATALQRQGELGMWVPSLGQEAAQVGSARALARHDMAFPTYREHGAALVRGVSPAQLLSLFRGVDYGGWDPVATGFHLYTLVIGAQTLHATGYAMGVQRDGLVGSATAEPTGQDDGEGEQQRDVAVLAYLGDGAMSQGDVSEAMIWAATAQAPVVFFCQNNQWAISEPTGRQSTVPLVRRPEGFGIPGVRVDGNDVLACRAVVGDALQRAREGSGPTFVEAWTYRMGPHTTSDDPRRYRSDDEAVAWRAHDPIARTRACLTRQSWADDTWFAALDDEADRFGAQLRAAVLALPDPDPAADFALVHAEQTAELAGQQARFVAYEAGFEPLAGGVR